MRVGKKNFSQIDNRFKATFENKAHLTEGKRSGSYPSKTTILDFFELYKTSANTIHFQFEKNDKLILIFEDSLGVRIEAIDGKFRKNRYYEIFVRNDKLEVPPLLPIIYGSRNIKRLRIALTKENELVIENKWDQSGNIFLFGGGGGSVYRSYFKQIPINQQKLDSLK